jgi:hypothetical protein
LLFAAIRTFTAADRPILSKFGLVLIQIALYCLALNTIIDGYAGRSPVPDWALCAAAPCLVLSAVLFYTEKHKRLKEKIIRRLFY